MPNLELGEIIETTGYPQQPHDQNNHNDAIQDALDRALHRYKPVNGLKQHSYDCDDDDNGH